ncbi:hypothetical protein HanRHA438_Chr04g0190611 [Helianthus annuus]|nr:hypothetical protein HanRHA438_Chr04g0190611 [Helianthus annuus]
MSSVLSESLGPLSSGMRLSFWGSCVGTFFFDCDLLGCGTLHQYDHIIKNQVKM